MEATSPPSYEEANGGCGAVPLIVQLEQYAPGRLFEEHLMSSGKLEKVRGDAIMLSSSISYQDSIKLLHSRVLDRSGMNVPSKNYRFFCRVVLDVGHDEKVLLDQGSWKAARDMLRRKENVQLKFMFSVVPVAYTGEGAKEKILRRLRGLQYGQTCLVEPSLPEIEEQRG